MPTAGQSTASLAGSAASAASTAVPMPPPVSTTDARPAAAQASASVVTSRAAAALASRLASRCTKIVGAATGSLTVHGRETGRPAVGGLGSRSEIGGEPGERLAIDVVRVEPA